MSRVTALQPKVFIDEFTTGFMKVPKFPDRSFFAKMLLLFALLFLGFAHKRGGLGETMKTMFGSGKFSPNTPASEGSRLSLVSQLQS